MLTLTDHGNAVCSSVVLLLCYPCDKCHSFYNAKSTKNKKGSQFPWELLNDLVFAISTQLAHCTYTLQSYKTSFSTQQTSFSIHLFYWLCGQLDKGGIHSIHPNYSTWSVPHHPRYKFILKWVVWVQLLKWWVKFFYTAKTR